MISHVVYYSLTASMASCPTSLVLAVEAAAAFFFSLALAFAATDMVMELCACTPFTKPRTSSYVSDSEYNAISTDGIHFKPDFSAN